MSLYCFVFMAMELRYLLRYANQNVEFRGLHGRPASSNASKSKAGYFKQFFTTGFEIDNI